MKYEVKFTNQFKEDLKLAKKQNKNLDRLFETVNIASGGGLDARHIPAYAKARGPVPDDAKRCGLIPVNSMQVLILQVRRKRLYLFISMS